MTQNGNSLSVCGNFCQLLHLQAVYTQIWPPDLDPNCLTPDGIPERSFKKNIEKK